MAVLQIQENIKKEDGTYDVVHKETEAGLIVFDDNETFQQKYDSGELRGGDGQRGTRWKTGTAITGTSTTAKAFSGSGITDAIPGDMYLNTSYSYVYECVIGGAASVATWKYVGSIRGATGSIGPTGSAGPAGQSAYQQAVAAGYTGTEAQFYAALLSLKNAPFMPLNPSAIWIAPDDTGGIINFGDSTDDESAIVCIAEPVDDALELHASDIRFTGCGRASPNPLPINQGGTGATAAATARTNLGAVTGFGPTTVTLSTSGWSGSGPWTQTVTVSGVGASDTHLHVYPIDIGDASSRKLYEKAYSCLAATATTNSGSITFTCRSGKPATNFQVRIEGVK